MMDWSLPPARYFWRLLSKRTRLYTEMVTDGAILNGVRNKLLRFDRSEHPIALQLGGSEPDDLAACAEIGAKFGYDEINLNCGCPSDRVQEGRFGACLMRQPERVADCVAAMKKSTELPVTVKCRIGVDDSKEYEFLKRFVSTIAEADCDTFIVHARKAWLQGLSPKENREIPPLHYDVVYRLKQEFPHLTIVINGGITTLEECEEHLRHVDGVMLGREAYDNPYLLAQVDQRLFGATAPVPTRADIVNALMTYAERELASGVHISRITRHILGLYRGEPNARAFRRVLSEQGCKEGAGLEVIEAALAEVASPAVALAA
jgi:tRNA-dihydrouridine synthase A